MGKLYSVIFGKYRKFETPKISEILEKTLVLSIIWTKCKKEDEKIFKEEESIEILKIIGLIENINLKIWFKNLEWNILFCDRIKTCATLAGIEKCKSITKKKS